MTEYLSFCDELLDLWRADKLKAPSGFGLSEEYVLEPYLAFDGALELDERPRLILLTTNPGGGMAFQCGAAVVDGTYREVQAKLAARYADDQKNYPEGDRISLLASDRIRKMQMICDTLRDRGLTAAPGFLQCEIVPMHSASLPDKNRLVRMLEAEPENSWLGKYLNLLERLLRTNHVIAVDASNRLDKADNLWTGWLGCKARLMGFNGDAERRTYWNEKRTVRFDGDLKDGLAHGYCLVKGGNRFAGDIDKACDTILKATL